MNKTIVIIIVLIALAVGLVMCMDRTPIEVATEEEPLVSQELIIAETAVSHTVVVDDHFSLDGAILFPFDSAVLSDDGKAIIDERIAKYRGKVQDMLDIDVVGYADSVGAEDYNQTLSVERAQAVADYIDAQTGIPHHKIKTRGKGESRAEGDTAEDQAMDRRVIINVTGTLVE
ncbi:MAG: OmpA family protein [Gammaproteobacteria bacterium]|nr:OmpA family protein [Gammaproteobacteria bacterium]MDH3888521.1 OmpA family protein [Gammaproteobacteria bacterium]MDH3935322.1 OmpA family protein [Gammaproteobacteria bacterium]MDH3971971.1 OmpA family protein [Gammaproteobacteria bacterium]MDH3987060.1 OmpA family protein [Gammaproteobacteria bacterium]